MARTKQTGRTSGPHGANRAVNPQVAAQRKIVKERKKKLSRAEAEEYLRTHPNSKNDALADEAFVTVVLSGARKKQQGQKYWRELLAKEPTNQEAQTQLQKLVADAARKKQAYNANPQRTAGKERVTKKQTDAEKAVRHEKIMKDLGPLLEKKKDKKMKEPVLPETAEQTLREFAGRPPEHQVAIANESTHQMVNVRPKNLRSQVFTLPGVKKLITNKHDAGAEYNKYVAKWGHGFKKS
jgi:hypothetical protein